MQSFSLSPTELVKSMLRNRELIRVLVAREVAGRYRGSVMGLLWSFLHPMLMLSIYTFVFGVVFKARWAGGTQTKTEFALVLFAGLIMYNFYAECINRAPSLIESNVNYVKKIVFPLEILPWVTIGAALFHMLISLCVWMVAYLIVNGIPHATIMLFPLVVLPFIMLVAGLTWAIAALGVYIRDLAQVVGIITTVLLFLSPVFYPTHALPHSFAKLLYLNPLTPVIEQVRQVLYWGEMPSLILVASTYCGAALVCWAGFAWFQATRKGFADVI